MSIILFSLEQCPKCNQIKKQITDDKIKIVTLSHSISKWSEDEIKMVEEHNVLEDLKRTAPILVLEDKTKLVGQLRIQRWLNGFK